MDTCPVPRLASVPDASPGRPLTVTCPPRAEEWAPERPAHPPPGLEFERPVRSCPSLSDDSWLAGPSASHSASQGLALGVVRVLKAWSDEQGPDTAEEGREQ